ncbi:AraC family transcriptional regulator [Halomonadaceae bacterium KBTZ08]
MASAGFTISTAYLHGLTNYFEARGQDARRLLATFSLDPRILDDSNHRLAVTTYEAMLEHGEVILADPDIGLHVGERIKPGQYGALGYSIMNCATLEQGALRHMRYENLVSTIARTRYLTNQDPARLVWDVGERQVCRHFAEAIVASWVAFTRWITGRDLAPECIMFRHPGPTDTAAHERLFQCPVYFGQPQVEVRFPQQYLDIRLPLHDPWIVSMMDAYAEKQVREIESVDDVVSEARTLITERLKGGELSLAALAGQLGLSGRQLQRRLRESGLSYQSLVDDTRRTLALNFIMDARLSVLDVAFLVGFSDASAFQRAFRRWTGVRPGEYRNRAAR